MRALTRGVLAAALVLMLAACELPFSLGKPTTRAVENGIVDALGANVTFAMHGTYVTSVGQWTLSAVFARPDREDVSVTGPGGQVEAIVIRDTAYFRGQSFLAQHVGNDPQSQELVRAAGNAWWRGSSALAPSMPDLTTGSAFRTTFLGAAVTHRTDGMTMDGLPAIELSGPRADVYVRAEPPYYPIHVRARPGVVIDGLGSPDLDYNSFNRRLEIAAPTDVIDFSNLTTLPPIYTVVSVDTSRCASPCVVSATLKNLGGTEGAKAPSTVTFTLTNDNTFAGKCQAEVTPDVGYNATTTVSCTITYSGQLDTAASVTATADNPGHA